MEIKGKLFLVRLIIAMIILLGFNMILVIKEDPLSQYRFNLNYATNIREERYLAPGLLKNYGADTLILGTSMARNIKPSFVDKELNSNSIKISISGGLGAEFGEILKKSNSDKKIKTIVFGLDFFSMAAKEDEVKIEIPLYLYDDSFFNDYKYIYNFDVLKKVFINLIKNKKSVTKDDIFSWDYNRKTKKNEILNEFNLRDFKKNRLPTDELLEVMKRNFIKNIEGNLINEKEYFIFFPPYSYLTYKRWKYTQELEAYLMFKKWVIDRLLTNKNIKVLDYQSDKDIIYNLENYIDYSHYSQEIAEKLVINLKKEKYTVNKQNKNKKEEEMLKIIKDLREYE